MASKGAKILQVFSIKRKGSNKTSRDDRSAVDEVKEGAVRKERTKERGTVSARHGHSVDQLESELLKLRRSLEKKEAENLKLKTEVSTLRTTAITSGQPEPRSQALSVPKEDTSPVAKRSNSFNSDSSQLSCLDFSVASTGNLKFEGKIKTEIKPGLKGVHETSSIHSDTATASAPGPVETRSEGNDVSTSGKERITTKGELDVGDKLFQVTKIRIHESTAEVSKPKCEEKYCHGHFGGDLKFPESVKEGLDLSSRSSVRDSDDESVDLDGHQSRSPPKSTSSTEEHDDFVFPSPGAETYLEGDKLFSKHTADSLTVANMGVAAKGRESSSDRANLEVDEKSLVIYMKNHEEVEEKAPNFPVGDEKSLVVYMNDGMKDHEEVQEKGAQFSVGDKTENGALTCSNPKGFRKERGLTIVIPSSQAKMKGSKAMEDRLKVETGLKGASYSRSVAERATPKVMSEITQQAVAAASRRASIDFNRALDEKSLNTETLSLEVDHNKLSKAMKSSRRLDSPTSSKYPDLISRSTSMLSPPRSRPAQAQATPYAALSLRSRSPDPQTKARNFPEQPKTSKPLTWVRNERDLESKALTVWRPESQAEPITNLNSFDIESRSPSHGRNSNGASNGLISTEAQEHHMTTGGRHDRLSLTSSSLNPSAREISKARYSAGSQLLYDKHGWRAKSSGSEPFPLTISDLNRERSLEDTDLEEEVRLCLETSRLLLMSNATSSDDGHSAPASPVSREASCSVLALARQRRSMERNRSSVRSIPEIQQNLQERWQPQDHLAIVPYVDDDTSNIQTSEVDDGEAEARRRMDDNSIISLQVLNNAVIAYDQKHAQPACVPEALDRKLGSLSSMPRRSRFFMEANSQRFSQVTAVLQ